MQKDLSFGTLRGHVIVDMIVGCFLQLASVDCSLMIKQLSAKCLCVCVSTKSCGHNRSGFDFGRTQIGHKVARHEGRFHPAQGG